MTTLSQIKTMCREFLGNYFGTQAKLPNPNLGGLGLRLVCLGNPERTVQAELMHFLRAKGFNAVSECGVVGKLRRSLDVVMFDDGWQPKFVIELKHYSANQGGLTTLIKNLKKDHERHDVASVRKVPLIQIGLYTDICNFYPAVPEPQNKKLQSGLYRFLKIHYKGPRKCNAPLDTRLIDKSLKRLLISPASSSITIDGKYSVNGRVHYILTNYSCSKGKKKL